MNQAPEPHVGQTAQPGQLPADSRALLPDAVVRTVKQLVALQMGLDESAIGLETDIGVSERIDSLDLIELVMAIENEFALDLPDDRCVQCKTVGQAVDLVLEYLQ